LNSNYDLLFLFKCQNPILDIDIKATNYLQPLIQKRNDLFSIVGKTNIKCDAFLANAKKWLIYEINEQNGLDMNQIDLVNNPTINYAQLVIQPQTLNYGLYRFVFNVTMTYRINSTIFSNQVYTYVRIEPSGLILSGLSLSQGIYGGTIEISRGQQQPIAFNPYFNSYDIDSLLVITTLQFKYSCQIIDSCVESGFPQLPGTNATIFMDEMKMNSSLEIYDKCFNSSGV
jgi:hypothetical protein